MDGTKGYDFELVLAQDVSELKCPICLFLLRQTTELPCSHTSCSSCLQQWELKSANQSKYTCPVCQTVYRRDQIRHSKQIDRFITSSLQVKCSQHNFSCQWMGTISSYFESHETTCPFKQLQCQNVGCEETPMRKDMGEHLTKCNYRRISCSYCQSEIVSKELQAHHDESCEEIEIECINEGCQKTFPKSMMSSHILNDCLQTEVACTFHHVGCKDKMKRHELQDHTNNNNNNHTNLLLQEMLNMKSTLESQILDMQSKLTVLETQNSTFESKIKSLNHEHNQQILEMKSKINVLESENTTLKDSLTKSTNNNRHKETDEQPQEHSSTTEQGQKEYATNEKHDDELKEMNERIKQLEMIKKPQPNTTPLEEDLPCETPQQQPVEVQILTEEEKEKEWNFKELQQLLVDKEEDKFIALIKLKPKYLHFCDSYYYSLLHWACLYGSRRCTKHLHQQGANPFLKNKFGDMAIHCAAFKGHADVIEVLLKGNPSMLNEIGQSSQTALHIAAKHNHEKVVELLISYPNINLSIKDSHKKLADRYFDTTENIKQLIQQKRQESN